MRPVRNAVAVAAIPGAIAIGFFAIKSVALTLILAALAGLVATAFVTGPRARNVFLGLSSVILCIGIAELALRFTDIGVDTATLWSRGRQQFYSAQVFQPDWDLGYSAIPNSSARVGVLRDGKPVYDVLYSFDAQGGRAGGWAPTKAHAMVVAGDSFNFGEGLNDDQTLSSYLQSKAGNRLSVPNLALPGYGIDQVLRQLELDVPGRNGASRFDWLVISIVDSHIEQANARFSWSQGGPHYAIEADGKLRLVGKFGPDPSPEWLKRLRAGSRFYGALAAVAGRLGSSQDELVFVEILRAIRDTAERKYKAKLLVLYHPGVAFLNDFTGRKELMHQLLREAGVTFVNVNEAIRGIDGSYFIPGDGHPAAKLNAVLADLVIKITSQ